LGGGFATSGFTSSSLKAACQAENVQLGSRIGKKNLWKTHRSLKLIELDINNTIKYINTLSALVPLGRSKPHIFGPALGLQFPAASVQPNLLGVDDPRLLPIAGSQPGAGHGWCRAVVLESWLSMVT